MRLVERPAQQNNVGVLDAGVVLARLDPERRGHQTIVELFQRSARREILLYLSIVNLAEVLHHGRDYSKAVGLDLVTFVTAFGIELHRPDAEVARKAADFALVGDLSLADRFAAATAERLRARLYTTDGTLAAQVKRRLPVTRF